MTALAGIGSGRMMAERVVAVVPLAQKSGRTAWHNSWFEAHLLQSGGLGFTADPTQRGSRQGKRACRPGEEDGSFSPFHMLLSSSGRTKIQESIVSSGKPPGRLWPC